MFPPHPHRPGFRQSGFTLVEVVIASVIACILALCAYRALAILGESSRATADRVAAQGQCISKMERVRATAYEDITMGSAVCGVENDVPLNVLGISGTVNAKVWVDSITEGRLGDTLSPEFKTVKVCCSWTHRGRTRTESISGFIVNGYTTYANIISLSVAGLELNPNLDSPATFFVNGFETDEKGKLQPVSYSAADLEHLKGRTLSVMSVVVHPGGEGVQNPFTDDRGRKVENSKTSSFSCSNLEEPIRLTVTKENGSFKLNMTCEKVSFSSR